MATSSHTSSLLLFRVGPVLCCAPSLTVSSIILPPPLTHPPGSNPAKPGIFQHSGHIVSSLDLRYQFGVEQAQWVTPGRMVITQLAKGRVGFWIDEILEVIEPPASGWGPLPPLLPRGVFSRTLLLNEAIYLYAEFDALYNIPSHGYLRSYIQHLLDTQARHTAAATDKSASQPRQHQLDTTAGQHRDNTHPQPPAAVAQKLKAPASPKTNEIKEVNKNKPLVNLTETRQANSAKSADISARVKKVTPTAMTSTHRDKTVTATQTGLLSNKPKRTTTVAKASSPNKENPHIRTSVSIVTKTTDATAALPKYSTPTPQVNTEKHNSTGWFFVFFLLVLLAGTIWSVWTLSQSDLADTQIIENKTPAQLTSVMTQSPSTNTSSQTEPAIEKQKVDTNSLSMIDTNTEPTAIITEETKSAESKEEFIANAENHEQTSTTSNDREQTENASPNKSETETPPEAAGTPGYRATIEQDNQGLTIMIDAPDDADVFKTSESTTETASADISAANNPATSSAGQEPATSTAPPTTPTQPVLKTEVIHIVVKGDTLWHIAIRYLNNPFLYPELARLSNIKNPDLIYPGNRVRIVKRRKKSDN